MPDTRLHPQIVTIFDDGPIEIKGPCTLMNENGKVVGSYIDGEMAYLCRCGQSAEKPLCDGSHEKARFKHSIKPPNDIQK